MTIKDLRWVLGILVVAGLAACVGEPKSTAERITEGMGATRAAVQRVVEDSDRRATLLEQVDELEALLTQADVELRQASLQLNELNARADADRTEFESVTRDLFASRQALRSRALDVHYAMIASTTPEEWTQIVDRELDALGAVLGFSEEG